MARPVPLMLAALLTAFVQSAFSQAPSTNEATRVQGDDSGRFRVSALIKTDAGVKVGLVDRQLDRSYYLREGEKAGDVEIVSADYQREEVVIRHEGQLIHFQLAGDPKAREIFVLNPPQAPGTNAPIPVTDDSDLYPPHETPTPEPPPVEGLGPGIESYLKANPELAKELQKPQGRYGSGIESMIRLYPELQKNLDTPPSESGLGPAIEEIMKQHPELQQDAETNAAR